DLLYSFLSNHDFLYLLEFSKNEMTLKWLRGTQGKRALDSSFLGQDIGYTAVTLVGVLRREKKSEEDFGDGR
nr:probable LRR receptor-like serine/threonine-protein kinase RPK1 [Tanacetum cinerariifolium]